MAGRFLVLLIAVTFGLIVTVFVLNSLWMRMFGGASIPQPANRSEQIADRKKLREEHDAKEAEKREREKYSAETLRTAAHSGVPKALSEEEFDPSTGRIRWPEALQLSDYTVQREKLERLLKERAEAPTEAEHTEEAHSAAEELLVRLKSNIRSIPASDYVAAHHFLDGLIYALRPQHVATPAEGRK